MKGRVLEQLRRANTRLIVILATSVMAAVISVPQVAAAEPFFYIVNTATGMLVDVLAHGTDAGAPVVLWPHYGGTSQQFEVQRLTSYWDPDRNVDDLWFLLRARHSGKCLRTAGYQSGAPVVQARDCGAEAAMMWRVRAVHMTAAVCA